MFRAVISGARCLHSGARNAINALPHRCYNVPADEVERNPTYYTQAQADRLLAASGVQVVNGRADRGRKLVWIEQRWRIGA